MTLSGQVAGLLSSELSRAVNRTRELEAELLAVRDDVAQGSSAKADFLANISHELRTPVTVAKGIAYVLKNPAVPDEERTEFLDQLSGSLDKLMGIVDEIITLAELERGTFELSLVETDLAPLVRHALDEVRMRYPGIPIAAEVPDGLLCVADGPRLGLRGPGAAGQRLPLLAVRPRRGAGRPRPAEGVTVMVTDRGEGLDRAVATRAFEQPFSTGEGICARRSPAWAPACTWRASWSSSTAGSCGPTRSRAAAPERRSASRTARGERLEEPARRRGLSLDSPVDLRQPLRKYPAPEERCGCEESSSGSWPSSACPPAPPPRRSPSRARAADLSLADPVHPGHRRPGPGAVPDGWHAALADPELGIRGGFVASPRAGGWPDIDGIAVGMSATWVDATRVGVPSDFYYLAANGPLLSRLTTSANCREQSHRVYLDRRPDLRRATGTRPATSWRRAAGVCRRGSHATR